MANDVFANGREISCKAADGKSICAFPDVCFTPPQSPATPPGVPIPYPNTGFARDTTSGSRSVKISRKEVMLKNKSYFKKSTGDEAGSAPKKGILTSVNRGKAFFASWSMNVKFERENVVRHIDLTTHNHGSNTNTGTWPYLDTNALQPGGACYAEAEEEKATCADKTAPECCEDNACQNARKCKLAAFGGTGSPNCCRPQVAHHFIPNSLLQAERDRSDTNVPGLRKTVTKKGLPAYTLNDAPCVCCDGKEGVSTPIGTHKQMHDLTKKKLQTSLMAGQTITYSEVKRKVIEAHNETFRNEGKPQCSHDCLEAQINRHMKKTGTGREIKVLQKDGASRTNYSKYKAGEVE